MTRCISLLLRVTFGLLICGAVSNLYAQTALEEAPPETDRSDGVLKKAGEVQHPPINEMSGIVRSRWQENVWWVHNDSGDRPRLFAIDSTGAVHMPPWHASEYAAGAGAQRSDDPLWPGVRLGAAAHIDYEDIAVEDSTLYLGDIGNNGNARRDLGIYVIPEPFHRAIALKQPRRSELDSEPISPEEEVQSVALWAPNQVWSDEAGSFIEVRSEDEYMCRRFAKGRGLMRLP